VRLGLPFPTPARRIAQLDEALTIIRSLFTAARTDFSGRYYRLASAPAEPKPLQTRLPILVGGSGKKMLRLAATHADIWHGYAPTTTDFGALVRDFHAACADVGRDPGTVAVAAGGQVIIRDSARGLEQRFDAHVARHHAPLGRPGELTGTVQHVASHIAERLRAGLDLFICTDQAPFDEESMRRLATEAWPLALAMAGQPPAITRAR